MRWLDFFSLGFWISMVDVRLNIGSGGGPSGETKYTWNDDMAPKWRRSLEKAEDEFSHDPYQKYGGQRIAGINKNQNDAIESIRHFTTQGGSPVTRSANGQLQQTLDGDYLNGDKANPYSDAENYWGSTDPNVQKNQYQGNSPYFRDMMMQGMGDITNAYQQGTAADTTRMFNLSGAFGGSAHQNAVANNEAGLGKSLQQYASGMQNEQFNRSAGMEESYIGRDLQNQQNNKALGGQWRENQINRGNQNWQSERGNQMGAIGGGQNEQALTLQRANALMGVGDVQRGFDQDNLNQGYNDWQEEQQHPYKQLDWLTGLFSRAQGGMSPNSTTSQSGYSASPFSSVIGAGLLGKGIGLY